MAFKILLSFLLVSTFLNITSAEIDTAQSTIAPTLVECYNDTALPGITIPDNRFPLTMNTLIDLIRKIEDSNPNISPREIVNTILHRYRQSGISKTRATVSRGIPYAVGMRDMYKNQISLNYMIPQSKISFNNASITSREKCSLHYMLSSTFFNADSENCQRTARYMGPRRRRARAAEFSNSDNNIEVMASTSNCFMESGLVNTPWGPVKAGHVLEGIATGLSHEPVRTDECKQCDNRYSILNGEFCEYIFGPSFQAENTELGGGTTTNSTLDPKYFFLNKDRHLLQITDADLRGALDGFYLAMSADQWKNKGSGNSLKVSQILDLYYSERGLFNESLRACNRNLLFSSFVQEQKFTAQLVAYMNLYDKHAKTSVTFSHDEYKEFAKEAFNKVQAYLTEELGTKDKSCSKAFAQTERASTNISIYIDFDIAYKTIKPTLDYILENLEVNRYESTYTIYNGKDASLVVNASHNLMYLHEYWNETSITNKGLDYTAIFKRIENDFTGILENKTNKGGQSQIVLLVTNRKPNSDENTFIKDRRDAFISKIPDLTLLVLGSGSSSDYDSVLSQPTLQFISLPSTEQQTTLMETAKDVITKIKNVPRSIVNPECGSTFTKDTSTFSLDEYVEPNAYNHYRLHKAYFFKGGDNRKIKVKELSFGKIVACFANGPRPTNETGKCEILKSNETSFDIKPSADKYEDAQSVYLSIQGIQSDLKCNDRACRFPDNVKYTITVEDVGCTGGALNLIITNSLLFSLVYLLFLYR